MTIQDHSNCSDYSTLLPGENRICMDDAGQTIREGHVPKIRKQYTITKQRERWTEEEHKKFLEALKLFGRAWRKIEEHVGTKTAVQIRSHAQKFFSKVVRESHNSNSGSVKHMEIPPPRPKRKPMHPYPRKLVIQVQSARSTSPNSSVDQEHQSPTSVLSGFASEILQFEDSITPDGSFSPMSSHDNFNHYNDSMVQENISQLMEPVSVKLELSPKEPTSPKFLKLFGKTMLPEDPEKASTKLIGPSAPVPLRPFCVGTPFSAQDKATHNEGSLSGFTAGSVNAPDNCDLNQENGTQFNECSLKSTQQKFSAKLRRASSEKYTRAFVPYKRSLSEKGTQSSTTTCTVLID